MSVEIVVALIGAAATVIAAVIGFRATRGERPPKTLSSEPAPTLPRPPSPPRLEPAAAPDWIERLNETFRGEVEVYTALAAEPVLVDEGRLVLPPEEARRAEAIRGGLASNDWHAVLDGEPVWTDRPVSLPFRSLDFADVCALRESGARPPLLSVSVVLFSTDARVLYLHRRARWSATYPNALHTLGGGYMPPNPSLRNDRYSLLRTARRELQEEVDVSLPLRDTPPMLLSRELSTGFVQLALLGVDLDMENAKALQHNPEGTLVHLPFEDLERTLLSDEARWVPTGKAHVLAWLALGAPGLRGPWPGRRSPVDLFRHVTRGPRDACG